MFRNVPRRFVSVESVVPGWRYNFELGRNLGRDICHNPGCDFGRALSHNLGRHRSRCNSFGRGLGDGPPRP